MKRYLALILALVMLTSILCGCGADSTAQDAGNGSAEQFFGMSESEVGEAPSTGSGVTSSSGSTDAAAPANQKLVRKIWVTAETDDLDALLQQVDQQISALSGYAESRQIYHGSGTTTRRRTASLTIRIPAAQLDQFISQVTAVSNVISQNETADDITLTYVATQSRISALQTEHDRLLELLAKAETMSDLLKIEERLTDVRADLEEVTSKLKLYDNMVDYGTIYLELTEVKEYTVVEDPETVWQRIGEGFMQSLKDLGTFFTELFVFLVVALPYLAVIGVCVIVIVILIKHRRKKPQKPIQTKQDEH